MVRGERGMRRAGAIVGVAPVTFRVSSTGNVTGLALMSSSTCLKTEMAIRGRAIGGTLQLRLGNQYLELSKP